MESKVNYTAVGFFVLLLGGALAGLIFWLSIGGKVRDSQVTYQAFFDESVSGLNYNAPVRYRGVEVGRVSDISLAPDQSGRARVVMRVSSATPVKADTYAFLKAQGLTGLATIELAGGSPEAKPLQKKAGEEYPTLSTRPSLLSRLDSAVSGLVVNMAQTSENLNALTDAEMRKTLKRTLDNLAILTQTLVEQRPALESALKNAGHTMERTAAAADDMAKLAKRLQNTAASVDKMAQEIAGASRDASGLMQDTRHLVRGAAGQTLPEVNAMAVQLRELAGTMKRVGAELEQHPESLVFGRGVPQPGPGE